MIHVRRYLAAWTVLSVLCGAYGLAVAPWLEPPPLRRRADADAPLAPPAAQADRGELKRLFPDGHWARQEPKVFETEQCKLLIQDYQRLPDGRLQLKPCVLIFSSESETDESGGSSEALEPSTAGRTFVLEAPVAELSFDRPLDLAKAEFGRVQNGRLLGEVTIYGPATHADGRDELHMRTRAVQIDRQRISTLDEVEFRYGHSSGRGRELAIELLQPDATLPRQPKRKIGLRTITLRQLDYLRVAARQTGLIGAKPGSETAAADTSFEVTCRDGVAVDVTARQARFREDVVVRRLGAVGPADQIRCQELLLVFGDRPADGGPPADDLLAGRLQRIVASGSPVVLEAPSSKTNASAAIIDYLLAQRALTMKAAQSVSQVTLIRDGQHVACRELHYRLPDRGRLGQLQASGPGQLRLLYGSLPSQQAVVARWHDELRIQPQDEHQVISLLGAASVDVDPLGRLNANELHLWVLDSVPSQAASPSPTTRHIVQQTSRPAILPHRLLGIGDVRLVSPQLEADTSRLEAWFLHLPPEAAPAGGPPDVIREPSLVQPAAFSPSPLEPSNRASASLRPQRFHVSSGLVQMQLDVHGRRFDLEHLNLRGHAAIDELGPLEPGQQPIRLRGDALELRQGTRPSATLHVLGQPAEVSGRGMSLAGNKIELLRGQNVLKIEGPGEATMPVRDEGAGFGGQRSGLRVQGSGDRNQGTEIRRQESGDEVRESEDRSQGALGPGQTMHIVWLEGLVFDGLVARFQGDVSVRTTSPTDSLAVQTPALVATLSRRLDFAAAGPQPQPELARVLLEGGATGVYVESRGYDAAGEPTSRDQLRVRNLTVDRLAGTLHAEGPGWASTVRKGSAGLPGAAAAAIPPNPAAGSGEQPLSSVHVAFEREIAGRLADRAVEFRQQVLTTYAPAKDFTDVTAADPLMDLSERMFLMQSDVLKVTEFVQPAAHWFELAAAGNTQVRGSKFQIEAPLVSYVSDKEVITLQSDGRAKARIFAQQVPGSQPMWMEGDRFRYDLRNEQFIVDMLSNVRIPLPRDIKLPAVGPPAPAVRPNQQR